MNTATLARSRQQRITGGDVNYYLVEIASPDRLPPCVAEIEDIIEHFEMEFAEANVFKAIVRMTKLRLDLGKPGSSTLYEAEKAEYYARRTKAKVERRLRRQRGEGGKNLSWDGVVRIDEPKRLAPYAFHVDDFLAALGATDTEAQILRDVIEVCRMKRDLEGTSEQEVARAKRLANCARELLASHHDGRGQN